MSQTLTDKEKTDTFLTNFKALEKELVAISKLKGDYVSFSRALNQIYYNRMNPVISDRDNFDLLKTASDLRNILSHENDICAPSDSFLKKFNSVCESILHPRTCYDVCVKDIETCTGSSPISEVISKMDEKKLSHIPVMNSRGDVAGVFSRDSLFDYLMLHPDASFDETTTVNDMNEVIGFQSHRNESFYFVPRSMSVYKAFEKISKTRAHQKLVGMLFVTEHGKQSEKVLGIITMTDLAKIRMDDLSDE